MSLRTTRKLYYSYRWTQVKSQHPYSAKSTLEQRGTYYPNVCVHSQGTAQKAHRLDSSTPSSTTITTFGGHTIPHYGICELTLSHHGHSKPYAFHVVNTVGPTILGLPTCRDMKLVSLNYGIATTQTEKDLCQTHREAQMQSESFFATIRIASREFDASRGCFISP